MNLPPRQDEWATATRDRHFWAHSGPEEVAPGVHRLPLSLPNDRLRAVNTYVLDLPDGVALIDGGWAAPASLTELATGLAVLGRELTDVRTVLVTHIHRDHYTQAVSLRRKFGTEIRLGAGEQTGLKLVNEVASDVPESSLALLAEAGEPELGRLIRAASESSDGFDAALWEEPDSWLQAGAVDVGGREIQVIPTPGHTRGHVVFLDRANGLMFTGDHVLPHITPSIGFELGDRGLPLVNYLQSLHLVREMGDAKLLPAHGDTAASVHYRVAELLRHHEDRLSHTMAVVARSGEAPAGEVAAQLRWTRSLVTFHDLDDFDRMLAICETVAHLDVLVVRGDLEDRINGSLRLYRIAQHGPSRNGGEQR